VRTISQRIAAEGTEIVWRREAGGSFALRLTIDGAPYWVVLPACCRRASSTAPFAAATLTSALLALVGALAIPAPSEPPLERVVAAAGELARGAAPQPLPEDGPTETASLARSFNQLVAASRGPIANVC